MDPRTPSIPSDSYVNMRSLPHFPQVEVLWGNGGALASMAESVHFLNECCCVIIVLYL